MMRWSVRLQVNFKNGLILRHTVTVSSRGDYLPEATYRAGAYDSVKLNDVVKGDKDNECPKAGGV